MGRWGLSAAAPASSKRVCVPRGGSTPRSGASEWGLAGWRMCMAPRAPASSSAAYAQGVAGCGHGARERVCAALTCMGCAGVYAWIRTCE